MAPHLIRGESACSHVLSPAIQGIKNNDVAILAIPILNTWRILRR